MTTEQMIEKYHIALYSEDKLNVRRPPTGKTAAAEVESLRAAKSEILAVLQERQAVKNAEYAAAREAAKAEKDAKELPLIEAMNVEAARLRTLIPEGHVEVTVTETGNFDGYPIMEYTVGDVWLNWSDVTVHGWASATRPGAMNSFKDVCVASINRGKLTEIVAAREIKEAEKSEAENTAKAELAAKYAEAKSTGKPVEVRRFMDDCDDPGEECNSDIVTLYAMPNGSTKSERQHTW